MKLFFIPLFVLAVSIALPVPGIAQGAAIALGTSSFDSSQPVEISADSLSIDQGTGQAAFDGNVLVVQGDVRLSAGRIIVVYAKDDNGNADGIDELQADGGVTFVTPTDAAESEQGVYSVADGQVVLTGSVLLTQGPNALSGERLVINLDSGVGQMEGRVRTVIGGGKN